MRLIEERESKRFLTQKRLPVFGLLFAGLAFTAGVSYKSAAYPGGVNEYVTDAGPFCASCHSSINQINVRNLPPEDPGRRDIAKVHYGAIRAGQGPYKDLSPEQRQTLVDALQVMDKKAAVSLSVPKTALKPGQVFQVKATVTGGDGPVVGVMLVDSDLRYQARPVASSGLFVESPPEVTGPDGKLQTTWLDRRAPGTAKNLNFVQIYGVNPQAGPSTVTYTLRAPATGGTYPLAIAFLYGSEMSTELGTVPATNSPTGKGPRGGFGGQSGRVAFSELQTVNVR